MKLRKYLPSMPFVLLVGAFFFSAALIYGATYVGSNKKIAFLTVKDARPTDPKLASLDTDHDGLPDWEEAVRGTDPHNADSDGDGSLDGEEVSLGRDPSKPAPGDSLLSKENAAFLNDLLSSASSTNITDDVSRRLFVQYSEALNRGASGDQQSQEAMVKDALTHAKIPLHGKTYTQADLIVVANTKENIRDFANKSIVAISRHPNASLMNTVVVFGAAMDNNDPRAKAAFPILQREYSNINKELLRTPVPSAYASSYLQIINSYEKGGGAFEDMGFYEKDPVRALAGFANYVQMMQLSINMLTDIAQKISGSGILFTKTEAGGLWNQLLAPSA